MIQLLVVSGNLGLPQNTGLLHDGLNLGGCLGVALRLVQPLAVLRKVGLHHPFQLPIHCHRGVHDAGKLSLHYLVASWED